MYVDPFRASQFDGGYVAEFLPAGERTWRMVKANGKPLVFPTRGEAKTAAERAYITRMTPQIRSTEPVNPDRMEEKMAAAAEDWLRSKREDRAQQTTLRTPGRRPVVVLPGRARP